MTIEKWQAQGLRTGTQAALQDVGSVIHFVRKLAHRQKQRAKSCDVEEIDEILASASRAARWLAAIEAELESIIEEQ